MNWNSISNANQGPGARWGHTAVIYMDKLYLFGGYDGNYLNDFYQFDFEKKIWHPIKTNNPQGRSNHLMFYYNDHILIQGGGGVGKSRFGDLQIYNISKNTWSQSVQLAPRTYHAGCIANNILYIYGGESGEDTDLIEMVDMLTMNVMQCKGPEKRRFSTLTYAENQLFIIGGCSQQYETCESIYVGWPNAFVKMETSFKIARWGHSTQEFNGKLYIFGGRENKDCNELFELDMQGNVQVFEQTIKGRRKHCSAVVGNSLIIFGGFNGTYLKEFGFFELPLFSKYNLQYKQCSQIEFDSLFTKDWNGVRFLLDSQPNCLVCTDQETYGIDCEKMAKFSGYFNGILSFNCNRHIDLSIVQSQAFAIIILYCERGSLVLPFMSEQELFNLIELCEYLDIMRLRLDLQQYIAQTLPNMYDVQKVYQLSLSHQDDHLQQFCAYQVSLGQQPLQEINNIQKEQINQIKQIRKLSLLQ